MKLNASQLHAIARVAQQLDRLQDAIDGPMNATADAQPCFEVAGQSFQVPHAVVRAALHKGRDEMVQHLATLGIEWQHTPAGQAEA